MKFDATGKVLESESEIDFGGLPEAAQIYLKGAHAGQSPHEVTQETNAKGQTAYEVSYPDIEYLFDGAGLLLKKHEREKHDDQTDHENDNDDDDED